MTSEPITKRSGILDAEDCLKAEPLFTLSDAIPKESGYYWYKNPFSNMEKRIVQVKSWHNSRGGFAYSTMNELAGGEPVRIVYGCLWSARIPEPKEN